MIGNKTKLPRCPRIHFPQKQKKANKKNLGGLRQKMQICKPLGLTGEGSKVKTEEMVCPVWGPAWQKPEAERTPHSALPQKTWCFNSDRKPQTAKLRRHQKPDFITKMFILIQNMKNLIPYSVSQPECSTKWFSVSLPPTIRFCFLPWASESFICSSSIHCLLFRHWNPKC